MSYTLITGRTAAQGDGLHHSRESDVYIEATALVEMNASDMDKMGIKPEQKVVVSTDSGQVEVKAKKGDLPSGMIFMPMGPAANQLVGGETSTTGMPSFKGLVAEVKMI